MLEVGAETTTRWCRLGDTVEVIARTGASGRPDALSLAYSLEDLWSRPLTIISQASDTDPRCDRMPGKRRTTPRRLPVGALSADRSPCGQDGGIHSARGSRRPNRTHLFNCSSSSGLTGVGIHRKTATSVTRPFERTAIVYAVALLHWPVLLKNSVLVNAWFQADIVHQQRARSREHGISGLADSAKVCRESATKNSTTRSTFTLPVVAQSALPANAGERGIQSVGELILGARNNPSGL